MISGECPYCEESFFLGFDFERPTPYLALIDCEKCGKGFYEKVSRIDPTAYKMEDVVVNEETNQIVSILGVKASEL